MATIHKLKKAGSTIYPATITDAVVHQDTGATLTEMINLYNVSQLFPTSGEGGSNTYTLEGALTVLVTYLTAEEKVSGIHVSYIDSENNDIQEYIYQGGTFTSVNSWNKAGDIHSTTFESSVVEELNFDPYSDTLHITPQIITEEQRTQVLNNLNIPDYPDFSEFVTKTVDDLVNYYTKSETYSKTEVNTLIESIRQFTYVIVDSLPTASEETMYKLYLVPNKNVKDEYITLQYGNTYAWQLIGSTEVDLSGYSTTEQMNQAISNALENYYTKSEVNTLIENLDQFKIIIADSLPTASADTMRKLYFIPSTNPGEHNIKNEFVTLYREKDDEITYFWEQIGSSTVDLINYPTKQEMNTALSQKANSNEVYSKNETYNKSEVNSMITTPNQNYITVDDYASLPASGSSDTIYRVSNWNGTSVDTSSYSEYAWDGNQYVLLSVKSQIGEVFDISAYHATGSGLAKYANLSAALGTNGANIPESIRKGGMSIKFVLSSDNKYVEYFLPKDEWSVNEGDWEKMNIEEEVNQLVREINGGEGWAGVELPLESTAYYQFVLATNRIKVSSQSLSLASCARIRVNPGDKFKIFGADKSTPENATRLWCFSDGTVVTVDGVDYYSVLSVADDRIDTRETGAIITAPEGAAYLSICFQNYDPQQDILQKWQKVDNGLVGYVEDLEERVEGLESHVPEVIDSLDSDSVTDALSAKQGKVIGDELYGVNGYNDVDLDLTPNSYFNCLVGNNPPYTVNPTSSSYPGSGMYCAQVEVQEGDKFKIYGKGNKNSTALYAFADSSNILLGMASNNVDYRTDGYEIIAPANAVRLVINFKEYDSSTDKLQKFGAMANGLTNRVAFLEETYETLEERVESLESSKSVIQGKNILVFGDSLVEFIGPSDRKTWCNHAAEISGANFINIGIGGTRLSSRVPMAHIFDTSETYEVNDYVYYLTDGHYHFYKCTTQHTGVWDANDFTEVTDVKMYVGLDIVNLVTMACDTNTSIETRFADAEAAADCVKTNITSHDDNTAQIERLKNVNFATVDAIIIMAGTNDYANAFGNSDSDNITEENGAINTIVEQLSTSYDTIPIYFVKEPVKWFPHTEGGVTTYPDENWCDVYLRNNMTLTEYFNKIEEQFKIINHIPVCDLYYGLGWNKHNFWNFYGIQLDGTHPYYGFRIIAEKIVGFVIANKLF